MAALDESKHGIVTDTLQPPRGYSISGRKKSVAEEPVTSVLTGGEVPIYDRELTADEEVLAALGYKPEFKREFSLWTSFCVSFAVLGLLPSFASTLYYGMGYAGEPGMVWGWLIAMVFIQCVAMSMAEICSSMPTSGGLYYAAAVLAPPGWGPLAAWITGWSNWLGQVTGAPSVDYACRLPTLGRADLIADPGNSGCDDIGCCIHHQSRLRTNNISDLALDYFHHAHPWLHK